MLEEYEKQLNCQEHLNKYFDLLVESFVDYYGENKRDEITQKFKKAMLIAYRSPNIVGQILINISKIITKEIIEKKMSEIPANWEITDLIQNNNLSNTNILPLKYFKDFYDIYKLGVDGRKEKYKNDVLALIQSSLPSFNKDDFEEISKTHTIPHRFNNIPKNIKNIILYWCDLNNAEKQYLEKFSKVKYIFEKVNPNVTIENVSEMMNNDDIKAFIFYSESFQEMVKEYESRMEKYSLYKKEKEDFDLLKLKINDEQTILYIAHCADDNEARRSAVHALKKPNQLLEFAFSQDYGISDDRRRERLYNDIGGNGRLYGHHPESGKCGDQVQE